MADLAVTAANVQRVTGSFPNTVHMIGVSGGAITAGQVVYFDPNDSQKVKVLQATNPILAVMSPTLQIGVALGSTPGANQIIAVAVDGLVNVGATLVLGTVYVASGAVAGNIAPAADLDASIATWYGVVLGVSNTAGYLMLCPTNSGVINP